MAPLKPLTQLPSLNLGGGVEMSDDALKFLNDAPQLETLTLAGCIMITDAGLKNLKGLSRLKTLRLKTPRLRFASVSEDGFKSLASLRQLRAN